MTNHYLGMISGTSVDGVDAVIATIEPASCHIVAAETTSYPSDLLKRLGTLIREPEISLQDLGRLDTALGGFFADCALAAIDSAGLRPADIAAIGHHGQTVFHRPDGPEPFTLQIGDPNVVAARTGVVTVADFRRLDIAMGGQGAPLVPAFHDWLFRHEQEARVILNIGGIANVTILTPGEPTTGFDTGPGNTLLDFWARERLGQPFDTKGAWAKGGRVDTELLSRLLDEPYFALKPPKSTGRERFNGAWLEQRLSPQRPGIGARDVQATLAELTAVSIARSIGESSSECERILICGGGARNDDLLVRLARLTRNEIETTDDYGIAAEWVEGAAFAWLAHARLARLPSNVPTVTGARGAASLGGVYFPEAITANFSTVEHDRRNRRTKRR